MNMLTIERETSAIPSKRNNAAPIESSQPEEQIHFGLAGVTFDKTSISHVDGERGALSYRGYSIEALAQNPSFEKTAYLLLYGEWPTAEQQTVFCQKWRSKRALPPSVVTLLDNMKSASPSGALRTALSFLGAIDQVEQSPTDQLLNILNKIPSIIITHHALRAGHAIPEPDPALDHATDFLRRLLNRPLSEQESHLINLDAVLHADHGANASTFTARVITSTRSDPYSAICGAIGAFDGPLHGGAIEGALTMLNEIDSPANASGYIARKQRLNEPIMGFGHRVYRGNDPRIPLYEQAVRRLSHELGDTYLLEKLDAVIEAMTPHRRFGIGPNPDLHPAVIYRLLGIPDDLATAVFILGRSVGWSAQILEQIESGILIRPRLVYDGAPLRALPQEDSV